MRHRWGGAGPGQAGSPRMFYRAAGQQHQVLQLLC